MNLVIFRKYLRGSGPRQFPAQDADAETNKMIFSSWMVISQGDKEYKLHSMGGMESVLLFLYPLKFIAVRN